MTPDVSESDRDEQRLSVEGGAEVHGNIGGRNHSLQDGSSEVCDSRSGQATQKRQERGLAQELANDPAPRSAERGSHRDLPPPAHGAGEQERCHVHRGNQEDESGHTAEHGEHRAENRGRRLGRTPQRRNGEAFSRVGVLRVLSRKRLADGSEFPLRLREGRSRREPTQDREP